jgi:hypothetical protein
MRERLTESRDSVMTIHTADGTAWRPLTITDPHTIIDRRPPRIRGFNGASVEIQAFHASPACGRARINRLPLLNGK